LFGSKDCNSVYGHSRYEHFFGRHRETISLKKQTGITYIWLKTNIRDDIWLEIEGNISKTYV
jgi:hypothetical protein